MGHNRITAEKPDKWISWERSATCAQLNHTTEVGQQFRGDRQRRARFPGAPFPVNVQQMGGAFRAELLRQGDGPPANLDLGWAPGDSSPQDDTLRSIRFDPTFKVGMILFEEVLARSTARGHDNASNPELVAQPAQGVQRIPSNGSVHNAIYLYPQVAWRWLNTRLEGRVGGLFAFSDGDVIDPYASGLRGGYNHNAYDKANAHGYLGTEVNGGLSFTQPKIWDVLKVRIGAQYGIFFPGSALSCAQGTSLSPIHKARFLMDISW